MPKKYSLQVYLLTFKKIDEDGNILSAEHAERYSKIKNDTELHSSLLIEGKTVFYEKPSRKIFFYSYIFLQKSNVGVMKDVILTYLPNLVSSVQLSGVLAMAIANGLFTMTTLIKTLWIEFGNYIFTGLKMPIGNFKNVNYVSL